MNKIKVNILKAIYDSEDGISQKELAKTLEITKKNVKKLEQALAEMKRYGDISNKKGVWRLKNPENYFSAKVARISPKSGFIVRGGEISEEFFVRGKDLRGAVPGDIVLAKKTAPAFEDKSAEAVVLAVLEESAGLQSGIIVSEGSRLMVLPDKMCAEPLFIAKFGSKQLHVGDKVAFSIKKRGEHHYEHTVCIEDSFGSCENARASAEAYLLVNGLHTEFPEEVLIQAQNFNTDEPDEDEIARRLDLRGEPIFTIDGADTKDIDRSEERRVGKEC